jgi:predicted AlkP superfamily pyrophosphatase or phosphodiesterase
LGEIIEQTKKTGTYERTIFCLLSSFGHRDVQYEFQANLLLVKAGLIRLDSKGNIVDWKVMGRIQGGTCEFILRYQNDLETEHQLFDLLKGATEDYPEMFEILSRENLSKLNANPMACYAIAGKGEVSIGTNLTGEILTSAQQKATHGFHPSDADQRGFFIVWGPQIPQNIRLDFANIVDILPTISRRFNIRMDSREARILF